MGNSQQCGLRQHPSNKPCLCAEEVWAFPSSILSIPISSPGSTSPELLAGPGLCGCDGLCCLLGARPASPFPTEAQAHLILPIRPGVLVGSVSQRINCTVGDLIKTSKHSGLGGGRGWPEVSLAAAGCSCPFVPYHVCPTPALPAHIPVKRDLTPSPLPD